MAGPRTPGPGPGTWLFGCWVGQRALSSRCPLQGHKGEGAALHPAHGPCTDGRWGHPAVRGGGVARRPRPGREPGTRRGGPDCQPPTQTPAQRPVRTTGPRPLCSAPAQARRLWLGPGGGLLCSLALGRPWLPRPPPPGASPPAWSPPRETPAGQDAGAQQGRSGQRSERSEEAAASGAAWAGPGHSGVSARNERQTGTKTVTGSTEGRRGEG